MPVRYERKGTIGIFTIDNPPVNAFTPPMHKEFYDYLQAFLADRQVHVGVLTGAGERVFCGGDDIKHPWGHGSLKEDLNAHFFPSQAGKDQCRPGWERENAILDRYKPIVAAVNGPAMGMGLFYLLTHTDIRLAVPSARFGFPEIAYGMGGAGGMAQVGRHLPRTVAMSMLLTGEPLSAESALRHDLINEIVEPAHLMERALAIAALIARHPPVAVRVEMEAFERGVEQPRREAISFTSHLYRLQRAAHLQSPENKELPLAP
ncbi:MAG TPA: enoyl-CoA hydratase/isomerase family protein [Alcaligenes sp.]|nr:enoyl-CoA hydratase/isomerase family protein [Alcaligenes sp.]HRL27838.1 enoyl-CoA hydratase/isomerase family protein [Alcaligenes sp.]